MKVYYMNDGCGSGKSHAITSEIVAQPGRYIVALERINEFPARVRSILDMAAQLDRHITIREVSASHGHSVQFELPSEMERLKDAPHAVIICTHAALKLCDHAGEGWSLYIDEDPKLWMSGTIDIATTNDWWGQHYNLTPVMDGYSRITLKADAPSHAEMRSDTLTLAIAPLHDRIRRRDVVVNLTDWSDLMVAQTRRLTWFTIWDVTELATYDRVTISANAFDQLITYMLIRTLNPSVELVRVPLRSSRQAWKPRDLRINYVADDHRATVHFLHSTSEGQKAVQAWCEWASRTIDPTRHYWCANSKLPVSLPGRRVSPKIAGSNEYGQLNQCSIIYAAKASPMEARVFSDLTGGAIDHDTVLRDREYEDLIQIAFRSSLRNPLDDRPVTLNVYDRDQAEFLADYFRQTGFAFRTTVSHIDLGITRTFQKRGRKALNGSPMTAAERVRRHREKARAGR